MVMLMVQTSLVNSLYQHATQISYASSWDRRLQKQLHGS